MAGYSAYCVRVCDCRGLNDRRVRKWPSKELALKHARRLNRAQVLGTLPQFLPKAVLYYVVREQFGAAEGGGA